MGGVPWRRNAAFAALIAVVIACAGPASREPQGDDYDQKLAKASATVTDPSSAIYPTGQVPTPLPMSRFTREDGFFAITPYDDRQLSPERKAADPVADPRWPAFVRCMQAAGFGPSSGDPEQTTQADIDALVAEVNGSGPAYVWSPRGPLYRPSPAGDPFLSCERHLYSEARPTAAP